MLCQFTNLFFVDSSLWKNAGARKIEPNPLPLGVYDSEARLIDFSAYSEHLNVGTTVLVTARIQCSFFKEMPFFQLVPLKMQILDHAFVAAPVEIEDIVF